MVSGYNIIIVPCPKLYIFYHLDTEIGGVSKITEACDWWSLGALLFELLTGMVSIVCMTSDHCISSHLIKTFIATLKKTQNNKTTVLCELWVTFKFIISEIRMVHVQEVDSLGS